MRLVCVLLSALLLQVTVMPPIQVMAMDEAKATVSLETLLAEALAHNPRLLAARKDLEAARARVPQAKALPAPTIGVEFEEIPRGSIKVNQASLMYQLIQSLPFPGKLSARHRVAVAEAQRAGMAFKQAQWDIATQVKETYYELFLLEREQEIQEEQRVWLKQAVATAQARYATGTAGKTDLLRLQTEELEAANALAVLIQRRQAMAAHMNHLLNRPAHNGVGSPEPVMLRPLAFSVEELVAIALERQPELLMVKYAAERAAAAHTLAKRELLPDLETMAELRDPAMGSFGAWDLTLAVALPFWFWTKWRYGLKAALSDQESAQAASQAMQNEIAKQVHEHWHEAQAAYGTAVLCRDGLIGLSRQAVSSAMAGYQGGRGSFMEVLESLRSLSERRRTYYQHLVAHEQHIVMLEQAVGMPLRTAHAADALTEGATP